MAGIAETVRDAASDVRDRIFASGSRRTPPDEIVASIDSTAGAVGKKLWRGTLAVMASGFGKGVLIAAAATTIVMGLAYGFMADSGPLEIAGRTLFTFGEGLAAGIGHAFHFLTHGVGLALLAVGGTLGAIADTRKSYHNITAEVAKSQAQNYDLARQLAVQPGLTLSKATPGMQTGLTGEISECSHCARELERRAREAQQQFGGIA